MVDMAIQLYKLMLYPAVLTKVKQERRREERAYNGLPVLELSTIIQVPLLSAAHSLFRAPSEDAYPSVARHLAAIRNKPAPQPPQPRQHAQHVQQAQHDQEGDGCELADGEQRVRLSVRRTSPQSSSPPSAAKSFFGRRASTSETRILLGQAVTALQDAAAEAAVGAAEQQQQQQQGYNSSAAAPETVASDACAAGNGASGGQATSSSAACGRLLPLPSNFI